MEEEEEEHPEHMSFAGLEQREHGCDIVAYPAKISKIELIPC